MRDIIRYQKDGVPKETWDFTGWCRRVAEARGSNALGILAKEGISIDHATTVAWRALVKDIVINEPTPAQRKIQIHVL